MTAYLCTGFVVAHGSEGYEFVPLPHGEFNPALDMRDGDEIATEYNGPTPMHPFGYHRIIGYWRPSSPETKRRLDTMSPDQLQLLAEHAIQLRACGDRLAKLLTQAMQEVALADKILTRAETAMTQGGPPS